MGLNHFILFFLLGFVHFSIGMRCVGCSKSVDISDQVVQDYLITKLQDLRTVIPNGTIDEKGLDLVRIKNVQEKVVAGIQYSYQFEAKGATSSQLYDCNLTVVIKPWLGSEQVTEYSCKLPSSNKNSLERRLLPGGETVIDVHNSSELQELKSFISQEIGKVQRSKYLMTVIQYLNATKQVVEGTVIKTTAQIGITNCDIHVNTADPSCQQNLQGRQVCEVQVWLKPWINFKKVIGVQCQPSQPLVGMCVGCPIEKDPNSPYIKQSLEKTLYKLNEESHSDQKLALVKINKVTSQVINGIKLTVYFDAQDLKSSKNYTCEAVVILPPSSSEEEVKDFNCTPVSGN